MSTMLFILNAILQGFKHTVNTIKAKGGLNHMADEKKKAEAVKCGKGHDMSLAEVLPNGSHRYVCHTCKEQKLIEKEKKAAPPAAE